MASWLPSARVPYRLHRSVLALAVTACLAFGSWPADPPMEDQPSAAEESPFARTVDDPSEDPPFPARTAD